MVFCATSNPVAFNDISVWSSLIICTKLRLIKIWYASWKTKKASYLLELIMRFVCSKVCRFSCVIKGSWINRNDHSCTSRRGCGIIAGLGLFLERLGRLSFECNVVGRSLFCGLGLYQAIQLAVLRKLQWVVFSEPKGGEELHSWGQSIPLLPLTLR